MVYYIAESSSDLIKEDDLFNQMSQLARQDLNFKVKTSAINALTIPLQVKNLTEPTPTQHNTIKKIAVNLSKQIENTKRVLCLVCECYIEIENRELKNIQEFKAAESFKNSLLHTLAYHILDNKTQLTTQHNTTQHKIMCNGEIIIEIPQFIIGALYSLKHEKLNDIITFFQ